MNFYHLGILSVLNLDTEVQRPSVKQPPQLGSNLQPYCKMDDHHSDSVHQRHLQHKIIGNNLAIGRVEADQKFEGDEGAPCHSCICQRLQQELSVNALKCLAGGNNSEWTCMCWCAKLLVLYSVEVWGLSLVHGAFSVKLYAIHGHLAVILHRFQHGLMFQSSC